MKRISQLIVFAAFISITLAQTTGKISGTVTSDDGKVLPGANISVVGTSIGTASGAEGDYTIINVPVGAYSLKIEYIGYTSKVIEGLRVNNGLTSVMNATLSSSAIAGDEVSVVAEKPLVKRDATNTKRVVTSEVIKSLPLRSVDNVVGFQAGVVDNHVRGGRSGDNAYYVDGVLMKDHWGGGNTTASISQAGTEEISLEAGGFGAEYGGANGGIVNITTKSGGQNLSASFESVQDFGAAAAGTDPDKLYSYGYQLNNFEVGGPITNNIRFWLLAEQEKRADKNPSYGSHPYAEVKEYQNALTSTDSAYIWSGEDLNSANNVFYYDDVVRIDGSDTSTTHLVGTNYARKWGAARNNGSERLRRGGNIGIDLGALRFKLGYSGASYSSDNNWNGNQLLNWENATANNADMNMFHLNSTFSISEKSYVNAVASMKTYSTTSYNRTLSGDNYGVDKKPWVTYGKRDPAWGSNTYYHRADGKSALSAPEVVYFTGHGYQSGSYSHRNEQQTGLRLDYVNTFGKHEIKAGVEYYNTTLRVYGVSQGLEIYEQISKLDADDNGEVSAAEVGDYNADGSAGTAQDLLDWEFSAYRNAYTTNIGYDIFGNESDSYEESKHAQAPGNPVSNRLYLQDQIEYDDIVIKAGLSFESWSPNNQGPDADGDGKADDAGLNTINTVNNRIDRTGWVDVETHSAIHPRFGFAFPISDKTNFRAQYGTYWQEPALAYVYLSDSRLAANISQGNMVTTPNPAMKPERTTSYEVGFTQQIGGSSALDIVGFYKEVRDYMKLVSRTIQLNGSDFNLAYYGTGDFGVTRGMSLNLSMRRVAGFLADFNYTWMEARGTGSDPATNYNIAWIGDEYPTVINRLDHDQTHTGSMLFDYRTASESTIFSGLGFSAIYSFGSGQAYTPSRMESSVFGRGWDAPLAAINSSSMPWYSNLDLRIDKKLNISSYGLNLYVLCLNALSQENIRNVQTQSGRPDTDGWLNTAEGQIWLQGQQETYPGADAAALYNDRVRSPSNWSSPRTVRIGLVANF